MTCLDLFNIFANITAIYGNCKVQGRSCNSNQRSQKLTNKTKNDFLRKTNQTMSECEAGTSSGPGPSPGMSLKARMEERKQKLKDLHLKRNEARQLNHAEVVEEDRRAKEPKNMEARKRRAQYLLEEEQLRQRCLAEGKDFEREKLRQLGADVAEALDKRKKGKTNPDQGFSTYEEAAFRKHNQLVKQVKPDMALYEEKKLKVGEAFYAGSGTVIHGSHVDTKEAIEKLAKDVEQQVAKREKYSRRRVHDDDADIDYINERNMKFNQKLERFYGQYTKEIKDNLERGTAV